MELIALIIGALILVGLVILWIRDSAHIRRVESLELYQEPESAPSSIQLVPVEQYGWLVEPEVQHSLRELEGLGFIQQGTFRIVEMQGLHVVGLTNSEKNQIASVYADNRGITWVDISAVEVSGKIYTTSNSLNQEIIESQNQSNLRVDKSWSVVELHAQETELTRGLELRSVVGISFPELFERSYSNDMKKLNESGGVLSRAAFRLQQEAIGENPSEEELEELYSDYVFRSGVLRLHEECCDRFMKDSTSPDAHGELLAVHKGIPIDLLLPFVVEKMKLDDKLVNIIEPKFNREIDLQSAFKEINELLPEAKRARVVGEVAQPTEAIIYQLPIS